MEHHNMLSPNKSPPHRTLIHKRSSHHSSSTDPPSNIEAMEASLIPVFYTKDGGKQQPQSHKHHNSKKGGTWKRHVYPCLALGMVISCMIWTILISTSLVNNGRYELYNISRNTTGKKRPLERDDYMTPMIDEKLTLRDPWLLQRQLENPKAIKSQQQRHDRCRPPLIDDLITIDLVPPLQRSSTIVLPEHTIEVEAALYNRTHWLNFCRQANINKKSRVVITNALSMPVATAFTLLIAKQCDVRSILIADALAPNIKAQRFLSMNAYRTIYRSIKTVKLVVPTHTAGLGKLNKNEEESPLQWLDSFRPSHILHFEPEQAYREMISLWEEYMPPRNQLLYQLHHSTLSMKQILSYCQSRRESITNVDPLVFLHVTTAPAPPSALDTVDSEHALLHEKNQDVYASVLPVMKSLWTDHWYNAKNTNPQSIQLRQVQFPAVHGAPWIMAHDANVESSLHMDDAMVALLKALQPQKVSSESGEGLSRIFIKKRDGDDMERTLATHAYRNHFTEALQGEQRYPYGNSPLREYNDSSLRDRSDSATLPSATSSLRDTYGIHTTRFPCASSCYDATTSQCDTTIWDALYPVSQAVTETCTYVMYFVQLDADLDRLFETKYMSYSEANVESSKVKVCRVAFVAKQSPLVQEALKQVTLEDGDTERYNGQLKVQDWTLVWLSTEHASESSQIDDSILRIEPSRFFASTVKKVMYTEADIFAQSADMVLIHIFSNIDRPARGTHFTKEFRAGLEHIHRPVEQEPALARSVSLFASEVSVQEGINTVADYIKHVEEEASGSLGPRRHFNYYKQMNHWMQSDTHRPLADGAGPQTYRTAFPWHWISTKLMVHDLQSEAARLLRCNWFDAHLYWGPDEVVPGSEGLSLAYSIGRQRMEGSIGPGLEEDPSWIPQLDPLTHERLLENQKKEAFIRIMKGDGK